MIGCARFLELRRDAISASVHESFQIRYRQFESILLRQRVSDF